MLMKNNKNWTSLEYDLRERMRGCRIHLQRLHSPILNIIYSFIIIISCIYKAESQYVGRLPIADDRRSYRNWIITVL